MFKYTQAHKSMLLQFQKCWKCRTDISQKKSNIFNSWWQNVFWGGNLNFSWLWFLRQMNSELFWSDQFCNNINHATAIFCCIISTDPLYMYIHNICTHNMNTFVKIYLNKGYFDIVRISCNFWKWHFYDTSLHGTKLSLQTKEHLFGISISGQ